MRNKIICFSLLWLLLAAGTMAQDSSTVLRFSSYLEKVKTHHPLARQASLQPDMARAGLLSARDGFDPVLQAEGGSKTFTGTRYYQYDGGSLTIPAWFGVELQAGVEYLGGNRLNPSETGGQTNFAGIRVPLAKNLLMDQRRAVLQQARLATRAATPEKKRLLNNLLYEAADAYWQWVQYALNYRAYEEVLEASRKRVDLVKMAWRAGDRAAVDTLEARVQYQQMELLQQEAALALENARLLLGNYLWRADGSYEELPASATPGISVEELSTAVSIPEMEALAETALLQHPELQLYPLKLQSLRIEKKLKFQDMLPKLDLKYNQLGKGYDMASALTKPYFENNYRWGISFSMPLRLSKGRGGYRLAKLKIEETRLEQQYKQTAIRNKVYQYHQQLSSLHRQLETSRRLYENCRQLQLAEERKFMNGESTLFLVNSRETKTLEAAIKYTELGVKYNKTAAALQWATGRLPDERGW